MGHNFLWCQNIDVFVWESWCLSAFTLNLSRLFDCISAWNDSSCMSSPNKEGEAILFSRALIYCISNTWWYEGKGYNTGKTTLLITQADTTCGLIYNSCIWNGMQCVDSIDLWSWIFVLNWVKNYADRPTGPNQSQYKSQGLTSLVY